VRFGMIRTTAFPRDDYWTGLISLEASVSTGNGPPPWLQGVTLIG
jgi:hypothetical protein